MSTHAEVFVELEDGSVTGTYVHYDGYPDTCGKGMSSHSYEEIRTALLAAQRKGGFRFIGPDKIETFDDKRPLIIKKLTDARERYVYLKRRDGAVDMVSNGITARLTPAVTGKTVDSEELALFLNSVTGALCMDDVDDAREMANVLLSEFSVTRK